MSYPRRCSSCNNKAAVSFAYERYERLCNDIKKTPSSRFIEKSAIRGIAFSVCEITEIPIIKSKNNCVLDKRTESFF